MLGNNATSPLSSGSPRVASSADGVEDGEESSGGEATPSFPPEHIEIKVHMIPVPVGSQFEPQGVPHLQFSNAIPAQKVRPRGPEERGQNHKGVRMPGFLFRGRSGRGASKRTGGEDKKSQDDLKKETPGISAAGSSLKSLIESIQIDPPRDLHLRTCWEDMISNR